MRLLPVTAIERNELSPGMALAHKRTSAANPQPIGHQVHTQPRHSPSQNCTLPELYLSLPPLHRIYISYRRCWHKKGKAYTRACTCTKANKMHMQTHMNTHTTHVRMHACTMYKQVHTPDLPSAAVHTP